MGKIILYGFHLNKSVMNVKNKDLGPVHCI